MICNCDVYPVIVYLSIRSIVFYCGYVDVISNAIFLLIKSLKWRNIVDQSSKLPIIGLETNIDFELNKF